jgi:mannonate dehydratase
MERTWRWFGKKDPITPAMLRQIGVEGIVTALHEVPNGDIWTAEDIHELKSYIEVNGLHWSVVESLPVAETIKYGGKDRDRLIENYKISLANLGRNGIRTVCYNFMPAIDWIRTDLHHPSPDGSSSLYFSRAHFAYFDCRLLQRHGAENDYSDADMQQVRELDKTITPQEKENLIHNIIVKTQGFVNGNIHENDQNPITLFKKLLSPYEGIDKTTLRTHLQYFLTQIMPVCDHFNINMTIHPDDPPFPVLGLPRIVTGEADIDWLLSAVDNPHNGLAFCAGSLSAGRHNNVPALAKKYIKRIHFVHLRSTDILPNGDFIETSHLDGRGHLVKLVQLFEHHAPAHLPMRIDHGRNILDDEQKNYNPGYPFQGRMYALAQITGIAAAVKELTKDGNAA